MYLTLPSNASMDHFPDNEPGHFYIKLPQTLTFSQDYEVALTEIQFANEHENIVEGEVYFEVFLYPHLLKKTKKFFVPRGQYINNQELVEVLNSLTSQVTFHYDMTTKKITVKIHDNVYLEFSQKLADILGLAETKVSVLTSPIKTAEHAMSINESFKSIFVYCDLVCYRPVGDVNVPLLRTLPPIYDRRDIIHHVYTRPYYMPLKAFNINSVEVRLATDRGAAINFRGGLTILTLHFRPRGTDGGVNTFI